jgi:hypothetical protein
LAEAGRRQKKPGGKEAGKHGKHYRTKSKSNLSNYWSWGWPWSSSSNDYLGDCGVSGNEQEEQLKIPSSGAAPNATAKLEEVPWLALISLKWTDAERFCVGGIIDPRWVLASAYCFEYHNPNEESKYDDDDEDDDDIDDSGRSKSGSGADEDQELADILNEPDLEWVKVGYMANGTMKWTPVVKVTTHVSSPDYHLISLLRLQDEIEFIGMVDEVDEDGTEIATHSGKNLPKSFCLPFKKETTISGQGYVGQWDGRSFVAKRPPKNVEVTNPNPPICEWKMSSKLAS